VSILRGRCGRLRIIAWGVLSYSSALHALSIEGPGKLLKSSGDAYVRQQGTTWSFGTAKVEKIYPRGLHSDAIYSVSYQQRRNTGWSRAFSEDVSWTSEEGNSINYSFRGNNIVWIGKLCPRCGMADVYVDGKLEARIDTYNPDFHPFRIDAQGGWEVPVFEKSWMAAGEHTIKIVVQKDRNMLSEGSEVYLDAVQVEQ
jgi:hypothetical protein